MSLKRRLGPLLERATEGEPDYWYGVVEPDVGSLWYRLCATKAEADKLAAELQGSVVVVVARILEDEDGDHIEPEN